MKNSKEVRVYYHDTDSYGVVWHGSCVKWFEEGRIDLCEKLGLTMKYLDANNVIFPVVDIHVRYKASAFVNDILIVETGILEVKPMRIVFSHTVKNKETGVVHMLAETTVVPVDNNGKLIKHLPDYISEKLR